MATFPQDRLVRIVMRDMDTKVRESFEKINLRGTIAYDAPLKDRCTFRVGGHADLLFQAHEPLAVLKALVWAKEEGQEVFILGGGANIVPSDKGIRGLTLDLTGLGHGRIEGKLLHAEAGISASNASALAADHNLAGLDFIYAMPGTLGGAAYMNARCYDGEMSQVLKSALYIDEDLALKTIDFSPADFSYKLSPFTNTKKIILSMSLTLREGNKDALWTRMKSLEEDRRAKGHFTLPCAGSVFKNNHAFGAPSGKIIDAQGLRGLTIGGAKVSDQHANIIVNTGTASAMDIRRLTETVRNLVREKQGFDLEPEILFVGDWSEQ